jgi:hypothetical protein
MQLRKKIVARMEVTIVKPFFDERVENKGLEDPLPDAPPSSPFCNKMTPIKIRVTNK